MIELKVGDKVRVVRVDGFEEEYGYFVGTEAVVETPIDKDGHIRIRRAEVAGKRALACYVEPEQLELVS